MWSSFSKHSRAPKLNWKLHETKKCLVNAIAVLADGVYQHQPADAFCLLPSYQLRHSLAEACPSCMAINSHLVDLARQVLNSATRGWISW